MTERYISSEQVAVLAERVEQQIQQQAETRDILASLAKSINDTAQSVAVMNSQNQAVTDALARLSRMDGEHYARIGELEGQVRVHSWTWKLFGTVSVLALGLVGWTFNQIQSLTIDGHGRDKRLTILEFIVGGRTGAPVVQSQKNVGP